MCIAMWMCTFSAYAAPDWSQIPEIETGSTQVNIQKMQCAFDSSNLYLHIVGGDSNTWDALPQIQLEINQTPLGGVLNEKSNPPAMLGRME